MPTSLTHFAQSLKEQLSPSQVVERVLPIKKAGTGFKAQCPFHQDADPSLHINDKKGLISCFVCGDYRDVIQFWQDYHKMEKPIQAMKALAEAFGIMVPSELTAKSGKKPQISADTYRSWLNKRLLEHLVEVAEPQNLLDEYQGAYQCGVRPFTLSVLAAIRAKANKHYGRAFSYNNFAALHKVQAGTIMPLWSTTNLVGFAHFAADNTPTLHWLLHNQTLYARTGQAQKHLKEPLKWVFCLSLTDFRECPLIGQRIWLVNGFNREFASKWEELYPNDRSIHFYSLNPALLRKYASIAGAYNLKALHLDSVHLQMRPIAI